MYTYINVKTTEKLAVLMKWSFLVNPIGDFLKRFLVIEVVRTFNRLVRHLILNPSKNSFLVSN